MITRFVSLSSRLAAAFAVLFTIAACGGGGGGGDSFYDPDGDTSPIYYLALDMLDADGNQTTNVTSASPATLEVTVTKNGKNGAPVANVVVSAETTTGTVTPTSSTALTNSAGVATFRVEADTTAGAGTITASVEGPSGTDTGTFNFQVGSIGLRLGYLDGNGLFIENEISIEPDSQIASQGTAFLSLVIVDENGDITSSAETVSFTSGCLATGQAELDPISPIVSGDGIVSTSYRSNGCTGNDAITASLEGSAAQAFGTVTVASSQANGITFVEALPTSIVLRGTGNLGGDRPESSTLTFLVVDNNSSPVQGIKVDFSLNTEVGGLSIAPESAISGTDGQIQVKVFAGDTPTTARVIATATAGDGSGQEVSTVSDTLAISTGLPDQDSISLIVKDGGFIVENGFVEDGVVRTVTARLLDNFGNPVPNGSSAAFDTEYGQIEPSCVTTDGECSVIWTSESPRLPELTGDTYVKDVASLPYSCPGFSVTSGPCPGDLGYTRGGRSTVTVRAVGEESFVDRNNNGIMDEDEKDLFTNLSEAFLDKNEDAIYNPSTVTCQGAGADSPQCIAGQEEFFFDFNKNGKFDKNNNPAIYNGLQCPPEGDGVWCSRTLVEVRTSTVLILSNPDQWYMTLFRGSSSVSGASWTGGEYTVAVSDLYNNRPPADSTLSITGTGDCTLSVSSTVPNSTELGAFTSAPFEVMGEGTQGGLEVTLTPSGGGAPYTRTFNCVPQPPLCTNDPNDPPSPPGCVP